MTASGMRNVAASKLEYQVGQVVYRIHFGRYEVITGVADAFVMFGEGGGIPVLKSDVRPLTPQERGEVRDGKR